MSDLHVVVLAAGKSTRMKSSRPKVLHDLAGRLLIEHVLHTAQQLSAASTTLVIGHAADDVRAALSGWPDLQFAVQSPQLGTGHALLQTEPLLAGKKGTVLLLYGDVPLLPTAPSRGLSKSVTRRSNSGRSARSTAASMRSARMACSMQCTGSPRTTHRVSTT